MHIWTVAEWGIWYHKIGRKPFANLTKIQRGRMVRGCIGKVVYDNHEEARRVFELLPPIEGKGVGSYKCQLCHGIHIGNSRSRKGVTRMEYVKVDSSQIAEVGYGEGHYGPETLGIRFKNKSGITEYHYGGVRHDMYVAFIEAESVWIFFKDYIKPFPELYPFMKVEADPNPTPPANGASAGRSGKIETSAPEIDAPSPGTALALIDGMADDKLFSPGSITDAQLATMRSDWLAEAKKYDISTESKRTELKRFARPLQKLRTGIEARAKELTGATKRKIAAIDTEKRRLVQVVGGIEDEVLAPLTEWENEDKVRVARLERTLLDINAMQPHVYADIDALILAIAQLNAIDADAMQEFKTLATQAKARALVALTGDLVRRQEVEAQRLELERLRAESASMAEADRQVEAKRQEDARIAQIAANAKAEAERSAAAEVARMERERVAAVERAELAEKMRLAGEQAASRRAEEAAAEAVRSQERAVEAERQRAADEAEAKRILAEARAANEKHRRKFIGEAADDLVMHAHVSRDTALLVVEKIAARLVSHLTITY